MCKLALLWQSFGGKHVANKKKNYLPSSFPMFPAHHGANGSSFYRRHRSSGTQTKGAYLIYVLLVMPPALGLVEIFRGRKW
jgi:hypothetical protein